MKCAKVCAEHNNNSNFSCMPGRHTHTHTHIHTQTYQRLTLAKILMQTAHFIAKAASEESSSSTLPAACCFAVPAPVLSLLSLPPLLLLLISLASSAAKSASLSVRVHWHAPTAYQILLYAKAEDVVATSAPSLRLFRSLSLSYSCTALFLLACALSLPLPLRRCLANLIANCRIRKFTCCALFPLALSYTL